MLCAFLLTFEYNLNQCSKRKRIDFDILLNKIVPEGPLTGLGVGVVWRPQSLAQVGNIGSPFRGPICENSQKIRL